jgi:hypothetical protein
MSKDYISLQAPCQILVDASTCPWQMITLSLKHDIHGNFMYLTHNNSVGSLIVLCFDVRDIITSYGQSKMMIQSNEFDRLKMGEKINMNISISSMKIKIMLTETPSK